MKNWKKYKRDKRDKENGYMLCPKCEKDSIERLEDEEYSYAERCSNGCYQVEY